VRWLEVTTSVVLIPQQRYEGSGTWVRFAAWDTAGNGAMTMAVRLGR
jgi:hypothetical protein